MARYEHSGNAQDAHLIGNLTSTGLGLTIDAASGWPTAATNKFWIAVDPDTASEEHILVNVRTGTALTIASIADRGLEGTTAVAHTTGAVVRHIFSATEATDMALQSVSNAFTAADNYFGANAAGGTGTRIHLGSLGSSTAAFVEAEGSGTNVSLVLNSKGTGSVNLQHGGTDLFILDPSAGVTQMYLQPNYLAPSNTSASATAGAAGAPPAQVFGYLNVKINGSDYRVPFYTP